MNRKNIIYTIILAVAIIFSYFAALPQSVIISIIMLIGGFFLLIKGADYFVDGSSSLAAKNEDPLAYRGSYDCCHGYKRT